MLHSTFNGRLGNASAPRSSVRCQSYPLTGKTIPQSSVWPMLTDAALITIIALVAISEYVSYTAHVNLKAQHIDNRKLHFQTIHDIFAASGYTRHVKYAYV